MSSISSSTATSGITASGAATAATRTPAAARSARRRHRVLATGVILLGLLTAGAYGLRTWIAGPQAAREVTYFTVEPRSFQVELREKGELRAAKSTDVISEVEGRSTIIHLIPEGTVVKQGDLLVELASNQINDRIREQELKEADVFTVFEAAKKELEIQRDKNASDIRKADLDITLKQLELDKYMEGDWKLNLRDAEIAIQQAEITLDRAKNDFESAAQLYEKKFITRTQYLEDEFNHTKAVWELEKAQKALAVLQEYTFIAEREKKKSDLEEAKKEAERIRKNAEAEEIKKLRAMEGKEKELAIVREQLDRFRKQKEKCRIHAPTPGFVVYYTGGGGGGRWMMGTDSQIKEGAEVHERQILMQLPDTSSMVVNMRIHESKTGKLERGQTAWITVDGIPGAVFEGRVTKIASVADSANSWVNPDLKEFETEVTLNEVDPRLKPGGNAQVRIQVETVTDKLAVPVHAVYAKGKKRYLFRREGNAVAPVEVALGPHSAEWIEIRGDAVKPSDRVLLAFTEEHQRMIPDLPVGQVDGEAPPPGAAPANPAMRRERSPRGAGAGAPPTAPATPQPKQYATGDKNAAGTTETAGAKLPAEAPADSSATTAIGNSPTPTGTR